MLEMWKQLFIYLFIYEANSIYTLLYTILYLYSINTMFLRM